MEEFIIAFLGLKEGKHEFKYHIDQTFFKAFENSLLEDAEVDVKLTLEKTSTMLVLNLSANGKTVCPCDRCGDDFTLPFLSKDRVIVKFGDRTNNNSTDEILYLPHGSHEIDISHSIYEMIILSLPNKRVHQKIEDCNQKVIRQLAEFKALAESSKIEKEADPRWDALKKLKINKK